MKNIGRLLWLWLRFLIFGILALASIIDTILITILELIRAGLRWLIIKVQPKPKILPSQESINKG